MAQALQQFASRRSVRSRRLRVAAVIGYIGAALLAAGCGGSPVRPSPPPPVIIDPPGPPTPPTPAPVPQLTKLKFLAFGDSLTYGIVHLTADPFSLDAGIPQSYPYKLQAMLSARYTDQKPVVLNAGQGGERASEAYVRLRTVLKANKPDVLLLMDGANDLLALGEAGIPATVDAMKELVRAGKGEGVTTLLLNQPPQRPGHPKAAAAPFIDDYNADLKRMADVEGITVIDVNSQFNVALQGPDGLHPSEAGYARIAEIVFEAIKAMFEKPAGAANRSR